MSDYIKREDAIILLQRYIFERGFYCDTDADKHYTAELVDSLLTSTLAADVGDQPRWIPVTLALPEDGQWVLAWGHGHKIPITMFHNNGVWIDDQFESYSSVTHWMPLPEPPEEVKG